MRIQELEKNDAREYIEFSRSVYKDNTHCRDAASITLKQILSGRAKICESALIKPLLVKDEIDGRERTVAACILCVVDRMDDVLQITFFEALEHQKKAVDMLLQYAKDYAHIHNMHEIIIGLNIHVNYGLGLLSSHFDYDQSLGSSYNPPYYMDYFADSEIEQINLVSYLRDMTDFEFPITEKLAARMTKGFSVREVDFKNLEKEAEIYTYLNNEAFKDHKFYYRRRVGEDLELFKEYKMLLKPENLLFLEYDNKPAGFMLWYPDYNQIVSPGRCIGFSTLLKSHLHIGNIDRFKISEIGILPSYQKTGGIFALFQHCYNLTKGRFKYCESGWIMDKNRFSWSLAEKWRGEKYKSYKAFVIKL